MRSLFFFIMIALVSCQKGTLEESSVKNLRLQQSTVLQARPVPVKELKENEICRFKQGTILRISSEDTTKASGFNFVVLEEEVPPCQLMEGYIPESPTDSMDPKNTGGSPSSPNNQNTDQVALDIPYYFYQWHNRVAPPGASCGLTSVAMLFGYVLKKKITPDELFRKYGTVRVAQTPEDIVQVYKDYGLKTVGSTRFGSFDKIKEHIRQGRPVIVHGYFTGGHIVLISGFNSEGFIVHDPAGKWTGTYNGGYPNAPNDPEAGKGVVYGYKNMERVLVESDGSLWMSWGGM